MRARKTDTAMKGYRTKKISLPGGKVIEIVYFSEPAADGAALVEDVAAPAMEDHGDEGGFTFSDGLSLGGEPPLDLHVCPSCESELVYPVSWEERDGDCWHIERRCPNCEWRHSGEYDQDEVEAFDDVLNDGTEELLITLRNAARTNMEDDVERLIEALHLDRIEPMDF